MALDRQSIYQGFQDTADSEMRSSNSLSDFFGWTHHGETARNIDVAGLEYLANSYEAQVQRDWLTDMWNKNNEYNTPMAQMARARAAGLNPNLLYGQPIAESQPASGGAEGSVGVGNPAVAGSGAARDISTLSTLSAQIDNIKADTALKESRSDVAVEEKLSLQYENAMLRFEKDAFEKANREGLIEKAIKAGFAQEINESDKSAYDVMEAAWNFLIYTGIADSENTGEYGAGTLPDTWLVYNPSALEKARKEFVGSQDAQIATYNAIMMAKKYERQSFESDNEFQSFLLEHKDEWWSKVIRGARWILREYGLPSFSLSSGSNDSWSRRNGKSSVSSSASRHRGFSFGGMRRR